jgi:ribosome-binding ATPase YchF (GTP1/OBG family)
VETGKQIVPLKTQGWKFQFLDDEARKRGALRLEGKEYVVKDGDILNIRFNLS